MPDSLTREQAMRFNRHVVLPQIDLQGQEKLHEARVLLIGMGGLGNAAAQSLCASGAGHLTLVDDDHVERHNLPRQILFHDDQCGKLKVEAAKQTLQALNAECKIDTVTRRADDDALSTLIKQHDIVLDCTDNISARRQINRLAFFHQTPLVSGAAIRFEGQLFLSLSAEDSPCYGCVEHLFQAPELSCTETGILSPVVGIIGLSQAMLTMQQIIGFGTLPVGQLHLFDGLTFQWQQFTVEKHAHCPVCRDKSGTYG